MPSSISQPESEAKRMDVIGVEMNGPHKSPTIVSVLDHGPFAAQHIPHLGHTVKESKVFHWRVQGWKKLAKNVPSPEFSCGGHKWRILLSPLGFPDTLFGGTISVHLSHNSSLGDGWHACVQFALVISNTHVPTVYTVTRAHHRFTAEEDDWGTTRYSRRKLSCPQSGQTRPIVEDDSAVVSVYMRVLADPTGVLWRHNFVDYDSKKETGCVGLKKQGGIGHVNATLQFLFYINYFRKAVYQIPTEDQCPAESVSLALQRVFYGLQTSNQSVETTELIKSFGWKSLDLCLHHDVQEFNRTLQAKLETLMKGTRAEGVIPKLFVGEVKSFVKCVNVDYESTKIEEFNNIELNIKGIKTLHDSFRDYGAIKMLDGELQYQTEGLGLQDARKSTAFLSFPPVLHLLLKCYEYTTEHGAKVETNDYFEFPFEIDLDDFLDKAADRTKSWNYKLHSVLVRSGDPRSGKYFALIKPDQRGRWLKFEDERVTPVADWEVLGESYGGEPPCGVTPQIQGNQVKVVRKFTNARMLVYIRDTAIGEVLAPLTQEDVPPHLWQHEERAEMEAKKEERKKPHLFLTVRVITIESFSQHEGFDLASFDGRNSPISKLSTFCVRKEMKYSAFKSRIAQRFSYSESRIRLLVLTDRQNGTARPDTYIPENEPGLTVDLIRRNIAPRHVDLRLYLDILPDFSPAGCSSHITSEKIQLGGAGTIIFLKHFDPTRQTLFGIDKICMPGANRVSDLIPIIKERMKWRSETQLKLYEEIKPGMIEPMIPDRTLIESEIQDGDIICFQAAISDQEACELEFQGLCSNPQQFYKLLQKRATACNRSRPGRLTNL